MPEGDLTAHLKLAAIPMTQIMQAVGSGIEVSGTVNGSADLRVPSARLRDLKAWQGSGKLTSQHIGALGWALTDAGATIRVGKGLLTLSDVTGALEGAALRGSAELKLTGSYAYEGQLALPRGNLASLQRFVPGWRPPLAVEGQVGITAEFNGTLGPFTSNASGICVGRDVRCEKVIIDSVRFRWTTAGDLLKLTDLTAKLHDGQVTGHADLPLNSRRPGSLELHFAAVDVGALAANLPALPLRLEGTAGGSVKVTLSAATASRPVPSKPTCNCQLRGCESRICRRKR